MQTAGTRPASRRRARRPAAHHLDLDATLHTISTSWALAARARDGRTFANALRWETKVMTGLRIGELHNLRASDIRPDGTVNVRMLRPEDSPWRRGLKLAKPRVTAFVNGQEESPTLRALLDYIAKRRLGAEDRIWPSGPYAWWHWVVHRLGPATGLQRKLSKLDGNDAHEGAPRYLIHPHAARACFVLICRRWPRRLGLDPVAWDAICALGGWDNAEAIRKSYYYADLDEVLDQVRASMPAQRLPPVARPNIQFRSPRRPRPSEELAAAARTRTPTATA